MGRVMNKALSLEMGRMSDYNIRPKPKVWVGSPNECRTFGRMLYATVKKTHFTGECTERQGTVVASKHVSTQASSEIGNYIEELQ